MTWTKAKWCNKRKTVTGQWTYVWSRNVFIIVLDKVEPISGQKIKIETHNDQPEWSGWKLKEVIE